MFIYFALSSIYTTFAAMIKKEKRNHRRWMKIRIAVLSVTYLIILSLISACDKLENGNAINEILPGLWAFSYQTDEELDVTIDYDNVMFANDGTCSISSANEILTGTYRASDAVIRIDYNLSGEERTMLWRIVSMSPYKIVSTYNFDYQQQNVNATVTLDRIAETAE